jgi:hypothetical protein
MAASTFSSPSSSLPAVRFSSTRAVPVGSAGAVVRRRSMLSK